MLASVIPIKGHVAQSILLHVHAGLLLVARMVKSSCGTIVMDIALGFWIKVILKKTD